MGAIPPLLLQVIESTLARAEQLDMDAMLANKDAPPRDVASDDVLQQRQRFLDLQLGGSLSRSELQETFERIINGNELQDVNYLEKGMLASRSICRLCLSAGSATGFLVGPRVLITNNHVFPDAESARLAEAQFRYERGIDGQELRPTSFRLEPERLFFTSQPLDFSVVAVAPRDTTGATSIEAFSHIPLIDVTGKVADGEWLTIVQHPAGQLKQVCVRDNQLLRRTGDFLWYSTDTMPGSSGSPVFSNDWLVVALHHSGVPARRDGKIQTLLGRDFDPKRDKETDIKWIANEGVRVSRIVQTLRESLPDHDLIKAVINPTSPGHVAIAHAKPKESIMSRRITVHLEISDGGEVRVVGADESFADEARRPKGTRDSRGNLIHSPADDTFRGKHLNGYNPKFGSYEVLLPELGPSIAADAAPLLEQPNNSELKYENFSVVMNKTRRLAFFSAANISAAKRFRLSGRDDRWLIDERIDRDHQIDGSYYKRNKLDQGHLTRREDMEYGSTIKNAVRSANGTCVYTNCVPQRDKFNRGTAKNVGDDARLWAGLENFIFEHIDQDSDMILQVFTGPVFSRSDPKYRGHKIPMEFWKVVAGIGPDKKLFATAYLLSQDNLIDVNDLDEAARELPLGEYQTYQCRVSEIENATGLKFFYRNGNGQRKTPLSNVDPLNGARRVRSRRRGWNESSEADGGGALQSFEEIVLM